MAKTLFTNEALFQQVADLMVSALRRELMLQGHTGTGKLIDSVEKKIVDVLGEISIQIYAADYGKYVNYGVKASKIPFSLSGNGGTSKYIEALEKYVLENGFVSSLKDAKSMAFAIAVKHKKEGMPTRDSYKHSVTGKRTEFINDAIDSITPELDALIDQLITREMHVIFFDSLEIAA